MGGIRTTEADLPTFPFPPLAHPFIEFFIREKKYLPPTSTIGALGVSATFAGCYAGWIEWRALGDGHCE